MAYFTQTDLENAVGADIVLRLLDDDNDGTADATVLAALQADADAEVNGYLTRLYTVSAVQASPPATVRRIAVDVAIQLAYLRRPSFLNERGETPWEARYKRAVEKLRELAAGKFRLDIDDAPERPANVKSAGAYTGTHDNETAIGQGVFKDGFGAF